MISDKKFTLEEFHAKAREFAQAFANKINSVDVSVELKQESPNAYLVTAIKKNGTEHYSLFLNTESRVETISVYNV